MRNVSRDQHIDQSAMSIESLLNTSGVTFLMTLHVRSALWTLQLNNAPNEVSEPKRKNQLCKENAWTFQIRVLWKTLFFCSDSSHLPGSPISTILLFGQVSLKVLAKLDSLPPRFSSKNMSPINKMSKLSAKNFDTLRKIHKVKLHTLYCVKGQ